MPPLPWKKSRFSQLVADHLHSPKRGGSLVVETGFPTSLIDLFVKNRDRLNKKKRCKMAHHPDLMMLTTPLPSPSSCQTASSLSRDVSVSVSVSDSDSSNTSWNSSGIADEIPSKSGFVNVNKVVEVADANHRVLVTVMKMMSLVLILAFCTKKITVGITVSALLLIFLDYVGKHIPACKLVETFSNAEKSLGSLIQLVLGFLSIIKLYDSVVLGVRCCSGSTEGHELNIPNEEIQIAQPNCNLPPPIEGIQYVKLDEFETCGVDKKEEDPFGCGVIELKVRRSRSAKIKSNIKKLVPKKLRNSKKKKRKDLENEETSSSSSGQGKVVKCEEQKQDADSESLSLFSSGRYTKLNVDEDDDEQIVAHTEMAENVVPTKGLAVERERNSETKRNSGYLIFFLIVLVGLVGGRVFALLLTLFWCLMIKSAGKFRRYVKVPIVWFPVKSL